MLSSLCKLERPTHSQSHRSSLVFITAQFFLIEMEIAVGLLAGNDNSPGRGDFDKFIKLFEMRGSCHIQMLLFSGDGGQ